MHKDVDCKGLGYKFNAEEQAKKLKISSALEGIVKFKDEDEDQDEEYQESE